MNAASVSIDDFAHAVKLFGYIMILAAFLIAWARLRSH